MNKQNNSLCFRLDSLNVIRMCRNKVSIPKQTQQHSKETTQLCLWPQNVCVFHSGEVYFQAQRTSLANSWKSFEWVFWVFWGRYQTHTHTYTSKHLCVSTWLEQRVNSLEYNLAVKSGLVDVEIFLTVAQNSGKFYLEMIEKIIQMLILLKGIYFGEITSYFGSNIVSICIENSKKLQILAIQVFILNRSDG